MTIERGGLPNFLRRRVNRRWQWEMLSPDSFAKSLGVIVICWAVCISGKAKSGKIIGKYRHKYAFLYVLGVLVCGLCIFVVCSLVLVCFIFGLFSLFGCLCAWCMLCFR